MPSPSSSSRSPSPNSPPSTPPVSRSGAVEPLPKHIGADALIPAVYRGTHLVYLVRPQSGNRRFLHADGTPLQPKRIEVAAPPDARLRHPDGTPRTTISQTVYALSPGDTLLLPAGEVLGITSLHPYGPDSDGTGGTTGSSSGERTRPSYTLGAGWCPLPDHAALGLDWSPDLRLQPFMLPLPSSAAADASSGASGLYVYDYQQGRHDFAPLPPYDAPALLPGYLRPSASTPEASTPEASTPAAGDAASEVTP